MIFNRRAQIRLGRLEYESETLDFDFFVPFSTEMEPDISEISLYNLSPQTIAEIKKGMPVELFAGYGEDMGLLCLGEVLNYSTKNENVDRKTTLKVGSSAAAWAEMEINKTYAAGITSQQILQDLLKNYNLTVADITLKHNVKHRKARTLSGKLKNIIQKIAKETETKIYINQERVFVRPTEKGDNKDFYLSGATGLLGSPERCEVSEGETRKEGYKIQCLLNHQITTDRIVVIQSQMAEGSFRVVKGSHNSREYITEMEVLPWQA